LAQLYSNTNFVPSQAQSDQFIVALSAEKVILSHQGRLLQVKLTTVGHSISEYHTTPRGAITCFSRRSRNRLLELTARLLIDQGATFITLTYGQAYPKERVAKRHLATILKRIRRKYPKASGVWRMEYQRRGAPHFHLLLFNCPFIYKGAIAHWWFEIVGNKFCDNKTLTPKPPFTRIEFCDSARKVTRYVSKYVAKVTPRDRAEGGFNSVPYLTGGVSDDDFIGRFWGVFNRAELPFAPLTVMSVTHSPSFYKQFKRAAAHQYPPIAKYPPHKGFKLFTDNGNRWQDYLLYCLLAFT